jgi:hypothetical protein
MKRFPASLVFAFVLCAGALCGCTGSDSYPEAAAAPAIGRDAKCDHCGKAISSVAAEHLLPFQGVEYTVCGEDCGRKLTHSITRGTFK